MFLQGNEKVIYEFVVRHFLACCSKDAQGLETSVEIDVNNERVNDFLNVLELPVTDTGVIWCLS